MARAQRRASSLTVSTLLGLAGTLAVAAACLAGLDRRAELYALDFRLKNASFAAPTGKVLHVDIEDNSLRAYGRWPWPREYIAGVIDVLHDCGAKTIALDIAFTEPLGVRYVSAQQEIYGADRSGILGDDKPRAIFDDAILAAAIRRAGNVALPIFLKNEPPDRRQQWVQLQADCKNLDSLLARLPANASPSVREDTEKAYLQWRGTLAAAPFAIAPAGPADAPGRRALVGPLVLFGSGARLMGLTNTSFDSDKIVRGAVLLDSDGLGVYPQFALALAAHELAGGRKYDIERQSDSLRIVSGGQVLREVPLWQGTLRINWASRARANNHIAVGNVLNVWARKTQLDRLPEAALAVRLQILAMMRAWPHAEIENQYWKLAIEGQQQLAQAQGQYVQAQQALQRRVLYDPATVTDADREAVAALQRAAAALLVRQEAAAAEIVNALRKEAQWAAWLTSGDSPVPPQQLALNVAAVEASLKQLDALAAQEPQLRQSLAEVTADLGKEVQGKICLVGYNSTGQAADFVATPIGAQTPGVVVHGNILDTILSGRFIRVSPMWLNLAAAILAGGIVTLITATRGPVHAALMVLALGLAYAVLNVYLVFGQWHVQLAAAGPLAAMLAAFVPVTVYRQLTEERARRQIRGMFAHALSGALVDQLIEDPAMLRPGKRAITCMFTDLAGFTAMAQNLGPADTVRVLNRYFDHACRIVQDRCGGYVNKFLGDGLLVLFGAPVVQEGHAALALAAAAQYHGAIAALNAELSAELGRPVTLAARVGLAGGLAMVGDCGSTDRMDYTAIGECVNLASRLEAANKTFDTRALADGPTWAAGGSDKLLARPIGLLALQGVSEPTATWEIMGFADACPPAQREAAGTFAAALEAFNARRFAQARDLFKKTQTLLGGDTPSAIYIGLCERYAAAPPPQSWTAHVIEVSK
ncbi:MAG: CHASE2 domain-containing protein [Planctomycetaceae bacterium]|nr:CHASE2 domain-containing protein [Planctomycetaceae bacterium]